MKLIKVIRTYINQTSNKLIKKKKKYLFKVIAKIKKRLRIHYNDIMLPSNAFTETNHRTLYGMTLKESALNFSICVALSRAYMIYT